MPKPKLTQKQKSILDFLLKYRGKNGYPPTLKEIGDEFGFLSINAAKQHLNALERKGYITLTPRMARGIEFADHKPAPVGLSPRAAVPLVGIGSGPDAEFAVEDHFQGKNLFAVRVKDDGMATTGIRAGDVVVAEKAESAQKGELVVAAVGEEPMVRTFFSDTARGIRLVPQNPKFEPIVSKDARIIGRLKGLLRKY